MKRLFKKGTLRMEFIGEEGKKQRLTLQHVIDEVTEDQALQLAKQLDTLVKYPLDQVFSVEEVEFVDTELS
ncbi:DUF2922 family protein [Atopobacter phocae]|uniref:DUF1659 domain-containing protein n=1 Tax=Atopobacter phocae TaxID=136492 RepID=UPI000470EBBF|nr:DUF2922 family protein [Atopobacter phocae]